MKRKMTDPGGVEEVVGKNDFSGETRGSRHMRSKPAQIYTNRVGVVAAHIPRYMVRGQARLATDAGVARSTISRMVRGLSSPTARVAHAVQRALEQHHGFALPFEEIFSLTGSYPTAWGCQLCQCRGCLPQAAYGPDDRLLPEYEGQKPGEWSLATPARSV